MSFNIIFIFVVTIVYTITYLFFLITLPKFFIDKLGSIQNINFRSVFLSILITLGSLILGLSISDVELGNRIQHAIGGGFVIFIIYLLALKDSGLLINKIQKYVLGFLIVTTLGVFNEILEFTMQEFTGFQFTATTIDTWLDLVSNTVGILLAILLSHIFIKDK